MKRNSTARAATFVVLLTLAAMPALAERIYELRYTVNENAGRFAFAVKVIHVGSGQPIMKSTLRTRPKEWGELQTGHAGRTVRVRVMGEANGYAELVLDVRERGKVVQHELQKYTERAAGPPVKYHGDPVSLHFRDAELVDVLLVFAEIGKTNIAVDPGIRGKVTLDLVDVPWDQALDLILKQHGLVKRVEGRVTFVSAR